MNPHLNILIVDDDFICQEVVRRMLNKLGIETDAVSNGLDAISALSEKPYDMVLMDIQMPKMNGIEATKEICGRWPHRQNIIIVSDCSAKCYRKICLDAGAVEFLSKPVKFCDMYAAVQRFVERRPHEQGKTDKTIPCL